MTSASETPSVVELSELRCAAGTDVGMRREENQDSFGVIRRSSVHGYFIADGMGGVHGGATASRLAISTLEQTLPARAHELSVPLLRELVQTINLSIFEAGGKDPSLAGMGTTLVGVVFTPSSSFCINVGDSRLYRVRGDSILQLSEDHTLVRELVRSGAIKPEEAETHPVSHMLTRSLGPLERVDADCFVLGEMVKDGDMLVLCSDGLYNFVNDAEILGVVKQNSLDDANQILINLANQRGGADNITVLVVAIGGSGGRSAEFRKARDVSSAREETDPNRAEQQVRKAGAATQVHVGTSGKEAPAVQEPKTGPFSKKRSEKRSLKNLPARTLPVPLLVVAALVFGLVAGDGARQFSRTVISFLKGDTSPTGNPDTPAPPLPGGNPLEGISADLNISRSLSGNDGGLPEIARQVQSTRSEAGARQRRDKAARERLVKARDFCHVSIKKLEAQVAMLSAGALSTADFIMAANRDADDVQVAIDQVELQIDAASRKLSQWYGRQKRLEEQDPLKLAAEVGASSEKVKGKKSELEVATYEFIKKRDEVELYPGDEKLSSQLVSLKERRSRLLKELQDVVRQTVEDMLLTTNEQLEDLKLKRDSANLQLQSLKQDLEIAKVLSDPDTTNRDVLKLEVIARLQGRQSALAVAQSALTSDDPTRIRQALGAWEGLTAQEGG
jgi:serine/threonine protein phosphatase PrpC